MIEDLIADFSPEAFGEWCREKFDRFTADPHDVPNEEGFPQARVVGYVNALPDGEVNRPLLVMSVYAGQKINERSSRRKQYDFARKQLQAALDRPPAKVKGLFTQGLFAFHDKAGNFRLSLVSGRADGKRLVYSDFKRQSFFVRTGQNNKTFRARMEPAFGSYGDLGKAFSVEALTKEFYNSLFAWYERAMTPESKVTFPNDLTRDDDDRTQLAEHLIRLITRLMFIWFIRQKDLIPDKIFEPAALKTLLKGFDPVSPKQDNYYRAILQNLFFATLNCEIKDRDFAKDGSFRENKEHFGIKLLYRYGGEFACPPDAVIKLFRGVPFLNGGLFECLDKKTDYQDGFSRNPKCVAHIPNNLFFDDRGLITLFSRYDFTVDENDPNDSDVALDPELLGKVFENLLGAYNPETKETAREQSGSFYTRREIVNYMVDESLVAHLRTQVPEVEESVIRQCLGGEESPVLAAPLRRRLVVALYHCRILDPACGSGAFPMGLLLKMVHLLQRLDPKNALWYEVVMAEAEKALAKAESLGKEEKELHRRRITESFDQSVNQPDYARKLYLIENCIFGVDIQPIAVQIAKLRAFITLVCDQTPDLEEAERNYRMLPLPNLETNFVAANSLIGLSSDFAEGLKPAKGGSRLDDPELVRLRAELAEVRHQHFRARNSSDKNGCRKRDRELRGKIKTRLVEIACKPDAQKIALYKAEIEKLREKRKRVEFEEWKEVIQSKPLQGSLFDNEPTPVQTVMRIDVNKEPRDRIDDEIRRHTRAMELEESRATNKSAFQTEADTMADWDPYAPNKSSPFFDLEWMFGFRDGFDIVIGNPPYGVRIPKKERESYAARLGSVPDYEIFYWFLSFASNIAKKGGALSYIIPNTFLVNMYAVDYRRKWLDKWRVHTLADLTALSLFESAVVRNCVLLCDRHANSEYSASMITFDESERGTLFIDKKVSVSKEQLNAAATNWQLLIRSDNVSAKLLAKIEKESFWLGQILDAKQGYIPYRKTTLTKRFGDKEALAILGNREWHSSTKETPNHKRELQGKDVSRYCVKWSGVWVKYGDWVSSYVDLKYFSQPRLLFREITCPLPYSLVAAYSEEEFVNNPSIITAIPRQKDAYDMKVLLGVCNSKLTSFFFSSRAPKADKGLFPKILVNDVRMLPIPKALDPRQQDISSRVARILSAKNEDPSANTSKLEAEIDQLVYQLYNLTGDEIDLLEGRDAAKSQDKVTAKSTKAVASRQPRKSVLTDDPDLS